MDTNTKINHLYLLRKYKGNIMLATSDEMKAAASSIPKGENALKHLHDATREYELTYKSNGSPVCFNKDGLCEDDRCRCRE